MGDAALRRALRDAMPLISRRLRELQERVDRLESKDPEDSKGIAVARLKGTYRGVWQAGRTYRAGDFVTRSGGLWHAERDTLDKPGAGRTDWVLAVKKGRASSLRRD